MLYELGQGICTGINKLNYDDLDRRINTMASCAKYGNAIL